MAFHLLAQFRSWAAAVASAVMALCTVTIVYEIWEHMHQAGPGRHCHSTLALTVIP